MGRAVPLQSFSFFAQKQGLKDSGKIFYCFCFVCIYFAGGEANFFYCTFLEHGINHCLKRLIKTSLEEIYHSVLSVYGIHLGRELL